MKKYDSAKRKWVSIEEYERTHHKRDKEICRGQKPHNFVLVLPTYVTYNEKYKFNPEKYYEIMDEVAVFEKSRNIMLEDMGILNRLSSWRSTSKLYICSVCKKQKYEFAKRL